MRLSVFDEAPAGLETRDAHEIGGLLDGPSLIRLNGGGERPLFISALLHGNETTSWDVARELISRARTGSLEKPILLFVGNIPAAAAKKRYIAGQLDYNRIWSGGDRPEHRLADEALRIIRDTRPFAIIDIHNNTGRNPLYSCVNRLEPAHLHLASMFSDIAVYYTNPPSALSIACSGFAPSIAVECGKSGDREGFGRALGLVEQAMAAASFHGDFAHAPRLSLYHTLGRVVLDGGASFSFDGASADAMIARGLEDWNFTIVDVDRVWARVSTPVSPLRVIDESGADVTDNFFRRDADEIRLKEPATPAMLSVDRDNARLDCLGYLMEPIDVAGRSA